MQLFIAYFRPDSLVQDSLPVSHVTINNDLRLLGNFLFDVFLQASQHKWFQNGVQSFKLDFVQFSLVE
jgi:hypothetical protein